MISNLHIGLHSHLLRVNWAKYVQKNVKITENSKNRLYKTSKLSIKNLINLETSINRFPNLQLRFNIKITMLEGSLMCKRPKIAENSQKQPKMAKNHLKWPTIYFNVISKRMIVIEYTFYFKHQRYSTIKIISFTCIISPTTMTSLNIL